MIAWGWLIAAFFLGDMMGIIVMAILYGSWSHKEQEAEKRTASAATLTDRKAVSYE